MTEIAWAGGWVYNDGSSVAWGYTHLDNAIRIVECKRDLTGTMNFYTLPVGTRLEPHPKPHIVLPGVGDVEGDDHAC